MEAITDEQRKKRLQELSLERTAKNQQLAQIENELSELRSTAKVSRKEIKETTQIEFEENKTEYSQINSGHVDSLLEGELFQNFVKNELYKKWSINVAYFVNKSQQRQIGESIQGYEVKLDNRCTGDNGTQPTYRICVEVAEKNNKENKFFTPSGIFAQTNTWLYIVGNYMQFWIFGKKDLIRLYNSGKYKAVVMPTIKHFYLTLDEADEYCLLKIICK
jgi:hypothetical protein